jgi:hypothetical protein
MFGLFKSKKEFLQFENSKTVNMSLVESFYYNFDDKSSTFQIVFSTVGDSVIWKFDKKEKRDEVYRTLVSKYVKAVTVKEESAPIEEVAPETSEK